MKHTAGAASPDDVPMHQPSDNEESDDDDKEPNRVSPTPPAPPQLVHHGILGIFKFDNDFQKDLPNQNIELTYDRCIVQVHAEFGQCKNLKYVLLMDQDHLAHTTFALNDVRLAPIKAGTYVRIKEARVKRNHDFALHFDEYDTLGVFPILPNEPSREVMNGHAYSDVFEKNNTKKRANTPPPRKSKPPTPPPAGHGRTPTPPPLTPHKSPPRARTGTTPPSREEVGASKL